MNPYLSIIIPVFNESERIGPTLDAVNNYMSTQKYSYEILIVDDGSKDKTEFVVQSKSKLIPLISFLKLETNKGKGAAIKAGMNIARGEIRLFMDADNSTDISHLEKLVPYLREGYDVVVGSRRLKESKIKIKQNILRDFLGAIFRIIAHMLLPLDIKDTQNGFKLFSKKAAIDIFQKLQTEGWSFDIEALLLAQKMGFKIKEVPIVWINDGRSKVRLSHMFTMLIDVLAIRLKQ